MALRSLPARLKPVQLARIAPLPKIADPYYSSPEHRAWRDLVIARAGGRCEWPGCGRAEKRMFADHIREIKDGGSKTDIRNGQCLCSSHHVLKTHAEREKRLR